MVRHRSRWTTTGLGLLFMTFVACGSKEPVAPTVAQATPTPTPRPTPTPGPTCVARVTPVVYDPDRTTCPFSGGTLVARAHFDVTAADNQTVKLVSVNGRNAVFNFNPEEVRPGRTERINLRYEVNGCIKVISPVNSVEFGPFTLTTNCGSVALTTANTLGYY